MDRAITGFVIKGKIDNQGRTSLEFRCDDNKFGHHSWGKTQTLTWEMAVEAIHVKFTKPLGMNISCHIVPQSNLAVALYKPR